MKIELKDNALRFEDLSIGDTFIYNGQLFMKTNEITLNVWNFNENRLGHFTITHLVKKVNCKIVQID